jgi:UDP-N-acetylglucosamine transferase subunit ALG13
VIFVTAGTLHYPFDRMLHAVAALPGDEEVVVQCAAPWQASARVRWIRDLPYDELAAYMRDARVVVSHAGVGSVLTALRLGRRPVVVPRLERYGEAVDDHQLAFGRKLAELGHVVLVEDPRTLAHAIEATPSDELPEFGVSALALELREELGALLDHSR